MPKIPIDFKYGAYEDAVDKVSDRSAYNCYPETVVGSTDRTILRAGMGYEHHADGGGSGYAKGIVLGIVLYYVSGNELYSQNLYAGGSPVLLDTMSTSFSTGNPILASNGRTIVIIHRGAATTTDHYWDTVSGTGGTIASRDANWSGFGKALDVCVKDGYFFFITAKTVFHGSNVSTTDGLTFNPLSYAVIPSESEYGVGVAVAGSQIYAFTQKKTLIYQTAPTTPFSFALSTGFDMDLGLSAPQGKVVFDDKVFMVGTTTNGNLSCYVIEGTSYREVSNSFINKKLPNAFGMIVSTYVTNSHRMVFINGAGNYPVTSGLNFDDALTLDLTETDVRGYPVWHLNALNDSDNSSKTRFPIKEYFGSLQGSASYKDRYAVGVDGSPSFKSGPPILFKVSNDQSVGGSGVWYESPNTTTRFEYTFAYARNSGDSLRIKRIRLRFSDGVGNVELFLLVGGSYQSMGYFDLSLVDSKTAEWRRVGRINDDAQFKVVFDAEYITDSSNPEDGSKAVALIEGYFEV